MRALTDKQNWIPFLIAAAVILLWMGRTRPFTTWSRMDVKPSARINPRIVLICLVLSVAIADQAAYRLKRSIDRTRPCRDPQVSEEIDVRWHVSGSRSFPSSHAANSAALATVTSLAYPPLTLPAYLLSAAVGFSRVYLGVHYRHSRQADITRKCKCYQ